MLVFPDIKLLLLFLYLFYPFIQWLYSCVCLYVDLYGTHAYFSQGWKNVMADARVYKTRMRVSFVKPHNHLTNYNITCARTCASFGVDFHLFYFYAHKFTLPSTTTTNIYSIHNSQHVTHVFRPVGFPSHLLVYYYYLHVCISHGKVLHLSVHIHTRWWKYICIHYKVFAYVYNLCH